MTQDQSKQPPADTVLVLDSEILVRVSIAQFLRECGFRVIEAATVDEAELILNEQRFPVDILLCDVDASGSHAAFQLAQWVRANRPDISVILAASPQSSARAAGDLCDDGPMLSKPYEEQLLLERIKKLLASSRRSS